MKTSQKLIIILLLIALIPLSVIGFFAYSSIQNALSDQIKDQIGNTLTRQANKVDALITQDLRLVDLLAVNVQARFLLNRYYQDHAETTRKALNQQLTDVRLDNRAFRRIHFLNTEGIVVGSSDSRFINKDYSQSEVFKRGKEGADVSFFFKDIDGVLGHYLVSKMVLNGEFLGVDLIEAQVDSYAQLTSDYVDTGETGETFLVGDSEANKGVYLTPLRFNQSAALAPYVPSTASPPRDYRDHPVLLVTKEVPITRWTVGVKIDRAEIFAPVLKLRNLTFIILGVTIAVVFALSLYLARFFTRPIIALTRKTEQITAGDLDQVIEIKSSDEIGILASSFNTMTTRLRELYRGLERKVAERTTALNQKVGELEDAKAKDDAILDSIGEGLVVTDSNGYILLANANAVDLRALGTGQIIGKKLSDFPVYDENEQLIPPNESPILIPIQTGHTVVKDVKADNGDKKRALNLLITPIMLRGKLIGVLEIIRDVTKEKEVDRMKTEFISLASHQLRTPLSAIKWFSEMMINGDVGTLTKEQTEFAQNISDSSERMIELVGSLLNISRIESGRIIIDPKPTDLKKLVEGIVTELQVKLNEKKHHFALSVHNDLPLINVDPQLTRQIYLNLLTNAIKYTPDGGEIAVMISRNGDQILSQVTDNGYGIPKDQQHKVFQRFFRAENVVKVITDGTGLGLYLIKAIVESQQGKIWFESQANQGTTFWFSLPMAGVKAKKGEVSINE